MDDSSCNYRVGKEVRIIMPYQRIYEYSIHLQFSTSNNVAEYETTIHEMRIVKVIGASMVKLHTYFLVKEVQIIKYAEVLDKIIKTFNSYIMASTWEGGEREIMMESTLQPTFLTMMVINDEEEDWSTQLHKYLKDCSLPTTKEEAQKSSIKL